MRWMVALLSCVLLLHLRPASAQSSSASEHARLSLTSVHRYIANDAIPAQLAPPPNLLVPDVYRPLIDSMLHGSRTFRRQCLRIAAEPALVVRLSIGVAPLNSEIRAMTRIRRGEQGKILALVDIGLHRPLEEWIAHELEHVIEQLDGIDLAARAALPRTGVVAMGARAVAMRPRTVAFETTRAKRIGLMVISELGR